MSVLFIANVGNREIALAGDDNLPVKARLRGQAILDNWDTYSNALEMPILGKALEWVSRIHGRVDHVVLIASDQQDSAYRDSDTIRLAEVVQRLLTEHDTWRKRVDPENIRIEGLGSNPADYDAVMRFYERLMVDLKPLPVSTVYLAVSGGTPAMASMLLLKGVMEFGERAYPLYVTPTRAMPMSLDIGRQLTLDATRNDLMRALEVYQYHAGLKLLDSREESLQKAWPAFSTLRAVMAYAKHRLNFDFEAAQAVIFGAERGVSYKLAEAVRMLANDISERTDVWLLREVLHTAEISFRNGAYADFLGRAFRLSEGLTDHVISRWATEEVFAIKRETNAQGTTYTKKVISDTWLDNNVKAWEFLEDKGINLNLGVTRRTLLALADYFAGNDNTRRRVVKYLYRIDELGSYRNQMPFAHGYAGVSLQSLKTRYNAKHDDEILRNLKWLFEQVTGRPPGENPYDDINEVIRELLQGDA